MLRKLVRQTLIRAALRQRGFTEEQINKAFLLIEADTGRPILDWLIDGGFEQILEWIAAIIALFGGLAESTAAMPQVAEVPKVAMPPGAIGLTKMDDAVCILIPVSALQPLLR